jgi:hypothetical protein
MRTPQTLDRPVLKHPVKAATKQAIAPAINSQKPHLHVTSKGAASKVNRLPVAPPAN